ncbi:hypothetical protein [Bizionia paragorgiae]|uniref:hypothetical protein n=1 Tax=Bizionia paragorgiae TaxID=283786 RepID=UPI003A93FDF4
MKWINKRKIFDPSEHNLLYGKGLFAQSPQALVFKDYVRIYFSTRKLDKNNGKYLSYISYVDFNKSIDQILNIAKEEVIPLGELGAFDEHGIFPINPLKIDNRIKAYTCGWSRRKSVSVETGIGIVESYDNGKTFKRLGKGPILSASLNEPVLVGDAFVKKYSGIYHMWYIYGKKWMEATVEEPAARVYKIAHATSIDGMDWRKDEEAQIILDVLGINECQALPTVIKANDLYHMFFCFRQSTDFRKNPERSYRLGYAFSKDLKTWMRNDQKAALPTMEKDWDSEMVCYPNIFECDSKIYLLYNGNEFGKYGFGIAELII